MGCLRAGLAISDDSVDLGDLAYKPKNSGRGVVVLITKHGGSALLASPI